MIVIALILFGIGCGIMGGGIVMGVLITYNKIDPTWRTVKKWFRSKKLRYNAWKFRRSKKFFESLGVEFKLEASNND